MNNCAWEIVAAALLCNIGTLPPASEQQEADEEQAETPATPHLDADTHDDQTLDSRSPAEAVTLITAATEPERFAILSTMFLCCPINGQRIGAPLSSEPPVSRPLAPQPESSFTTAMDLEDNGTIELYDEDSSAALPLIDPAPTDDLEGVNESAPRRIAPSRAKNTIEIRCAAFFPASNLFRKIYCEVGTDYQVEASRRIYRHIEAWANAAWFSAHGQSLGLHNDTNVNIGNISLGVKYLHNISENFDIYAGIGASVARLHLKNCGHGSDESVSKYSFGGVAKSGVRAYLYKNIFLDLFVDYAYLPTHLKRNVNIGGVKAGLGVGFGY